MAPWPKWSGFSGREYGTATRYKRETCAAGVRPLGSLQERRGRAVLSAMRLRAQCEGRDGRPTAATAARLSPSAAAEAPPYNGKQLWGRFSSRGHQKNFNPN